MTTLVHLIMGTTGNPMHNIIRDLKKLYFNLIKTGDWPASAEKSNRMDALDNERAGKKNPNNEGFQFWQKNNNPIESNINDLLTRSLHYTHYNPVKAGFVSNSGD